MLPGCREMFVEADIIIEKLYKKGCILVSEVYIAFSRRKMRWDDGWRCVKLLRYSFHKINFIILYAVKILALFLLHNQLYKHK